ncbi:hypothetical protein [Sorangium sp. So ce124]|uniref:hypothetical protein n=1 Tax=Sorangium sp. So ce124 TaxID=3133280 RepID=UPI003F629BEC
MSASRGDGHPDAQADWMSYRLLDRLREPPLRTTCLRSTGCSLLRQQQARAAHVLLAQQPAVAMGLLRLGSVACRAPARQHHPIRHSGRTRRSTGRSPRFA